MHTREKELQLALESLPASTLFIFAAMLDEAALDLPNGSEEQKAITGLTLDIESIGDQKIRGEGERKPFTDLVNRAGSNSRIFEQLTAWYQAQLRPS